MNPPIPTPPTLEARLSRLERSNRRWRLACGSVVLLGIAGVLIAQTGISSIQPTILCRGVKIFDPQGRKRGEFVMANGSVAVRMFDDTGHTLSKFDVDDLSFLDTDGTPKSMLSFTNGLQVGTSDGTQTAITSGGLTVFDSNHFTRAVISLGRTSLLHITTQADDPSLALFRADGQACEIYPGGGGWPGP